MRFIVAGNSTVVRLRSLSEKNDAPFRQNKIRYILTGSEWGADQHLWMVGQKAMASATDNDRLAHNGFWVSPQIGMADNAPRNAHTSLDATGTLFR